MTPACDGLAAIAVWLDDAVGTDGCALAEFLFCDKTADFMVGNLHLLMERAPWGVHPMPQLTNPAPGLSHDHFRRAHDEFRGAHLDYRRSHDNCIMAFVSRVFVPAPFTSRENAAGGGEEGDDAGKQQDFFHIR